MLKVIYNAFFLPILVTLQIDSLSKEFQISIMNTTARSIIGTLIIRGSIPVSAHAYSLDYIYSQYFQGYFEYLSFSYYREVLGDEIWRYILFRPPTFSTEPSNWSGISNMSTVCYDNSVPVISTPLTVYTSSLIYTPGPLFVRLYVMSYNPYYYISENYKIVITTPDCAPTERFDPVSQKCVNTCGCGLVNHILPYCIYFGKPTFSCLLEKNSYVILKSRSQPSIHICSSLYQLHYVL